MKKTQIIVMLLFASFTIAQAKVRQWAIVTNNNEKVAVADIDCLLASDNSRTFSIVKKSGEIIEGVKKATVTEDDANAISSATGGKTQISLYPNPVSSTLSVSGSGDNVYIYSTDGQLLKSATKHGNNEITVNVSDLAKGYYLLRTDKTTVKFFKK